MQILREREKKEWKEKTRHRQTPSTSWSLRSRPDSYRMCFWKWSSVCHRQKVLLDILCAYYLYKCLNELKCVCYVHFSCRHRLTFALFWAWSSVSALSPLVPARLLLSLPLCAVVRFGLEVVSLVEVGPLVEVVLPLVDEAMFVERVVIPRKNALKTKRS